MGYKESKKKKEKKIRKLIINANDTKTEQNEKNLELITSKKNTELVFFSYGKYKN